MAAGLFDKDLHVAGLFSPELNEGGLLAVDTLTDAGGGAGTTLIPGVGSDTVTGRNPIMAFAVLMPQES